MGGQRNAGLFHRLDASFYYFALLKGFLFGIRAKLTALRGDSQELTFKSSRYVSRPSVAWFGTRTRSREQDWGRLHATLAYCTDRCENEITSIIYDYFTELCSGSEAGSCLRLIDFVYHSTEGLRVIQKKREVPVFGRDSTPREVARLTFREQHPFASLRLLAGG